MELIILAASHMKLEVKMKANKDTTADEYKAEVDELVRRKQWKRLLTATFVLDTLCRESSYGNKIEKEIYARTNKVYRPNPNELYPVLRYMESKGYVVSEWDAPDRRSKRIYSITEKGKQAAEYTREKVLAWLVNIRAFIDTIENEFR